METKFYIKNRENRMETIFKKVTKWVALFLCVFLGSSGAFAQTQTLLVDGASSASVCPGDPIVLTTSKFPEGSVAADILISTDGGSTWKASGTSSDPSRVYTFVMDMGSSAVMFKVRSQGLAIPVETNTVSVQVETKCPDPCNQSSSGDYINGTDFDPKSGATSKVPHDNVGGNVTNVKHQFADKDITFTGGGNGTVTNDIASFFGNGLLPSGQESSYSNYYWVEQGLNGTPFYMDFLLHKTKEAGEVDCKDLNHRHHNYEGKAPVWDTKFYRIKLRLYVLVPSGGVSSQMSIKLQGNSGSTDIFEANADYAEAFLYDDASNSKIPFDSVKVSKSFGHLTLGNSFPSSMNGKLVRLDVNFYGRFLTNNQNNSYQAGWYYEHWNSDMKVAFDYISAEQMSICMDNGAACIGENVTVNAAGFPYGADYVWEVENENGGWDKLIVNGYDVSKLNYQTVNIPVEKLGKRRYRVGDAKTIATGETDYLYFNVTGKDCEPVQPKDISVSDLCAPVSNYEFAVSPIDANPNVRYSWTLTDAAGKDITSTNLKFTAAGATTGRGDKVYVSLNSENARGKYYVKVQPITVRNSSDGSTYEEPAGTPILDSFTVYQSPVVSLSLNGFGPDVSESEKKLCPNDDEQGITAVVDPKYNFYDYVYTWENATAQVAGGNVADVTLPKEQACAGTLLSHTIKATVEIKDVGCPTVVTGTYKVDKLVDPTIDCSMLNDKVFTLGATDKFYVLELPKPEFSAGCDSNPDIKITVVTMPNDPSIASATTEFTIAKNKWEIADKTVKLPAGTASVTYSVVDACDKEASCTANIKIMDVTAPYLECDKIPSYTTYTKDQGGCFGDPGNHASLPTLTPPTLKDLNGVDGDIEGKYIGRYFNAESQDAPTTELNNFDTSVLLNNPYQVGTSYNLWEFKDASGNAAYCLQKIVVIDNIKPDVTCTSPQIGNIPTEEGVCGLSFNGYQAFLQEGQKPSAKDVCTNVGIQIEAEMFYKKSADTDLIPIPKSDFDKLIFHKGETYHLIWRFYKLNGENYDDCVQEFTVVDDDAPSFDCDSLVDVIVTANYVGVSTGQNYKEYASYSDDDELNGYKYIPTLETVINSRVIRIPGLEEYKDNCDENPTIKITLVGPGPSNQGPVRPGTPETPQIITKEITSIDDLKEHKFYEGITTLTFVFTDADGNSVTCQQNITVVSDETPATTCPSSSNVTLKSDENCEAILNFALDKVPTAQVTYVPTGLYFNFREKIAERNNIFSMEDALKFFPDNLTSLKYTTSYDHYVWNPMGGTTTHYDLVYKAKETFDISVFCKPNFDRNLPENHFTNYLELESCTPQAPMGPAGNFVRDQLNNSLSGSENLILSTSNSLSTPIVLTVYPYKAILRDSLGNEVATVVNTYGDDDKSPLYRLVPRVFIDGDNDTSQVHAHVCKYKLSKITNFKNLDGFAVHPLKEGNYTITWYFENHKDVEGKKESECTTLVTVLDTIAPKLICGNWQKEGTFAANDECELPTSEVPWFTKPTIEQLGVSDNCTTKLDEFSLSWERISNKWISTSADAMTEPFPIGTTTMKWIVADKSGNKSTCVQSIIIEDQTAPKVDCSKLPLITAYTTPIACEASSNAVIEAGLSVPSVDNDPCSPVGSATDKIRGIGVRNDGMDIFGDPYPLGQTTITWTFTDGAGNSVSCEQIINVIDTITPIFGECDDMEDLVYELPSKDCDAKKDDVLLLLGSHQAKDVCDPNPIMGVPYVDNNGTLEELPELFKRNKTYTIAWVFEDKAGNRTICYQSLEIKDVTAPVVDGVCPEPTKSVNATTECSVNFTDLQLPTPTFEDPCDGVLIPQLVGKITQNDGRVNVYYDGELESITYPVGTHTFLWIYSDAAGNKDTCSMELTVEDMIKPILEDCEVSPSVTVTVSDNFCEITPAELEKLIVHPKAFDECDDLKGDGGKNYIEPVIERWYDANEDGVFDLTELVVDADGLPIVWNSINFPKGTTMIRWIFADKAGNQVSCDKLVIVEDHTPPFFDCATIDPDTLRPVAPEGCDYEFADLKRDILDKLSYKAYDACTQDSIPGILTTDGVNPIPDSYTLESGVMYKLIWFFADEDGNKTTCDQWILPSHNLPLNVDCDALSDTIKVIAEEGTCEAIQDSVLKYVEAPTAKDPCNNDLVVAVPHFKVDDEFVLIDLATQKFVTGNNIIHWQFVSPWNLNDTAWCEQNIIVKGNKKFDIDCDVVAPTYHDTILDCGPADPANLSIKTPWVADPCLTESDTAYKRMGVGVRSDGLSMTDPFPLGNTQIKWTFTDFTGAVDTFCIQDIEIRSREELIINCDAIEDVHVEVAEGECTVDANKVQLPTPQYALHPCLKDENGEPLKIEGVPSRGDKRDLDSSYYVGRTLIIWTFTDTTNTLAQPVDTCHSYVQVGDVNEMPVDCENFPDTLIVLPDDKCELSWADFNFKVKPVVDLCTREIIDPVVSVTGLSEVVEYLEYKTYFVLESGDEVDVLEPTQVAKDTIVKLLNDLTFNLGASTITWEYNFKGTIFSCNQTISVKNKVAPSGGCESVPDELTIVAPSGECEIPTDALVDSLLKMLEPWPVAYDHCDKEEANPIKGKIYFDGKEITSDGSFSLPVGKNTVQWVFIDTAINTVGDTCDKTLIIQSDMAPIFDCQSLDTLNFETDKCEYTYEWNEGNIPQAKDTCTSEFFAGVGTRSDNEDLNAPYPIGKTIITWKFKSPYSTDSTICEQVVWVRTTAQPLFDCETLDTVQLFVLDGMCDEDVFTYLDTLTYPVAKDSCAGIEIPGIPLTKDSVEFSSESRFYVGDTTKIIWKFFHDSLNVTPKYCDQYVLVTSYNEPIFDCEALQEQDIKFEIAGCDTILGSDAIPTPAAVDYCTKDSVYGVGSRSDGKELNDPFPVGTTTITWLFKSPYSNISAECDQKVVVLSTQEIDFNCEDLDSIYVPIYDVNTCDTSGLILNAPVALHPCPEQSGVAEIKGVPFINKAVTITPNADSTEWTIDKIHVGLHKITWTFTDPSDPATLLDPVKECEQVLQIGDGTNASVDCKNYPDTTIVLDPTDCAISWEDMNLNIKPVFDVCSGELLVPTLSRSSGKAIEATLNADGTLNIVADEFAVGPDTITWYFEQIGASCEQAILVLDGVAPIFDCDDLDTLKLVTESGLCEASNEDLLLLLGEHAAVDSCTQIEIPGVPTLMDGSELPSTVKVGDTIRVLWTFKNDTLNAVAKECEQVVLVIGSNAPQFDCESLADTVLYLSMDECVLSSSSLELNIPIAKDSCTGTDVPGVASGLLTEYPVGTTQITWSFVSPYSTEPKECPQNIVVKDTIAPEAPCEDLTDTIKVRITSTVADILSVTLQEVKDAGLITPSMEDPCDGDIIATGEVANGTKLEEVSDFELGEHKIFWIFADKSGNTDTCSQIVLVEDWVLDTLYCPSNLESKVYSCVEDVPAPYETFEEFKDAGGSFTNEAKIKEGSFGYRSEIEGDSCEMTFHRIYFVVDVRGNEISCEQLYTVKDDVAPTLEGDITDMRIACTDEIPAVSDVVVADNCDPNPVVKMTETDNRSDDPSDCNYYNYEITRIWEVSDRCGNVNSYTQLISVIDSIAPTFTFPDNWKDTVLSNYLKGCLFGVPDFSEEVRSMISDNCQEINNLIIKQTPSANDTIRETTRVWVKVFDLCGNVDSISKVVYVQKQAEILSLEAYDITKCGSDSSVIDLWGQTTRFATGFRYQVYGDAWYSVPSNPVYDCYRDSISEESLVFSDNPLTYYDKFHPGPLDADKEIQRSLTELKRMSRSGKYIFVAVDTATMCKDTATSYLTINERPRVAIESGIMTICELTTVDSLDLYSYVKCVDDMGSEISNEGWTLGEDVYSFVDSVIMANNEDNLIYFVENACGKTTSEDTYITFCDSIPSTTEDSLKWVGGSEKNLAMLRSEDYKTKDSILLDVRKRFESEAIVINSTPNDPARIWKGEQVVLELNTDYKFDECLWYKVRGYFDYSSEVLKDSLEDEMDELLDIMEYSDLYELFENPEDTSVYYVTLTDGVCPAIPGQLLQVDVLPKLPTAFTPYDKDGMNDVYMEGRAVVIFDRYGAKVFEGDNGWDGTFKGRLADPGVYYSKVFLNSGMSLSGTIEIVKVK